MPVLSEEKSIYPDALLEAPAPSAAGGSWWVLYTKSRQEKAVARHLLAHEVPFYVPLVQRTFTCRQRPMTSWLPLFPGYVFLFGPEESRLAALTSNRISRVLPVDDPARLVIDLRRVRQLILSGAPLTPESRLVPGKWVRIRRGPMEGLEGTVLKRHGQTRVMVSVDFLQQGASIEVEDHWLELAEPPPQAEARMEAGRGRARKDLHDPRHLGRVETMGAIRGNRGQRGAVVADRS